MTTDREKRRQKATLELARTNPAKLYDETYYSNGCTLEGVEPYGRHGHWLKFFDGVARKIVRRYKPKTVIDAGCAFGLLVEALNDRGVDARGFDISEYAISNAREDMREKISVGSILDSFPKIDNKKYDLAICIEVLEHLPPEHATTAVMRLCEASDRVLFSSSPDDFEEPTHFNVLPTSEWLKLFAAQGFVPARKSDASFVAPHAFVVENSAIKRKGWRIFFRA